MTAPEMTTIRIRRRPVKPYTRFRLNRHFQALKRGHQEIVGFVSEETIDEACAAFLEHIQETRNDQEEG